MESGYLDTGDHRNAIGAGRGEIVGQFVCHYVGIGARGTLCWVVDERGGGVSD